MRRMWKSAGLVLAGLIGGLACAPRAIFAAEPTKPAEPAAIADAAAKKPAPELFIANLRPTPDAPESTAYGTATLMLAPDQATAHVVVSQANLSSPLVSAHLKLGGPRQEGAYLVRLPPDSPAELDWSLNDTPSFTRAALLDALAHGRIYVALDTRNHPAGELRGRFVRAVGSVSFEPPRPPPKLPATPPTRAEVARFLTQATFGPSMPEIDAFLDPPPPSPKAKPPPPQTFARWIDEQMAIPASSHLAAMRDDFRLHPPAKPGAKINRDNRQIAWWQLALTAPDQLRQRVAFALSEIFVVSDVNDVLNDRPEAVAAYYDLLARDAFGSFRQLLEDVTRSPVMGAYLSHLRNARADPKRGTSADENYAREVMQLFTIGLNELQPDGTLRLGADGRPIPTYSQDTIVETAKVFTGWGFYSPEPKPNFFGARENYFEPMMLYPGYHDDGPKALVGGVALPPGQGGAADLVQTLDVLCRHPNTGPFICRQLIQRLVTSNPSPAYVYRVAAVFADNGRHERGDLGAVVRAILLDYEARSPAVRGNLGYGKLKEPLLQATALFRAFDARSASGRFFLPHPEGSLGQAALRAPSVFNFFEPGFVLPGPLAAAGLDAPEYQIFTDTTAITIPNELRRFIHPPAKPGPDELLLNLQPLVALTGTPEAMLDYLDVVFCGGGMTTRERAVITEALSRLPPTTSPLERARSALDLVVTSPMAAIQR